MWAKLKPKLKLNNDEKTGSSTKKRKKQRNPDKFIKQTNITTCQIF